MNKLILWLAIFLILPILSFADHEDNCDPHDEKKCYRGDVYWYDSCGDREELYDRCNPEEECDDGKCILCESRDEKRCFRDDIYWYDSCGNREYKYQDCRYACENGRCIDSNIYIPRCGDNYCDYRESCATCTLDCGTCYTIQKPKEEVRLITIVTPQSSYQPTQQKINQDSIFDDDIGLVLLGVLIAAIGITFILLLVVLFKRR